MLYELLQRKKKSDGTCWIYFIKRLLRLKWFESLLVSFLSWKNRFGVWLVKSKRTNHMVVFRKGSTIWKSSSIGSAVEQKKQRRIPYHLKNISEKVWTNYAKYDWTQLQIHLRGDLSTFEFGTDSILKTYSNARRRLNYTLYGFRWWYKRAIRQLKRRLRYKARKNMKLYYKKTLTLLYNKPYIILNAKKNKNNLARLLRDKWLESKLRNRRETRNLVLRLQRKWILRFQDKKNKTWYFYHTEMQSAIRNGVMIHSLADYTSHPFGGKRYRKRNIIR